jgi:hypothetical protein
VYPQDRTVTWVSWILRIGAVMEFVGHGSLGLGRVAAWTSYFAVVGIPKATALALLPVVGAFDVTMALVLLFYPFRALILYMAAWGAWTAVLRPLAGESSWEAVERAGNFGVLGALFLMGQGTGLRSWFHFHLAEDFCARLRARVAWVLRLTTVFLLAGHGALGLLVRKPLFAHQYGVNGLHAPWLEPAVGAFEIALALAVLGRPGTGLLIFALIWKLATEALSPIAGSPIWVFIEHGGSYAAPLALAIMVRSREAAVSAAGRSPLSVG